MAILKNAGQLRERIVIERPIKEPDSFGQPIETWSEFAAVWAAKEPLNGREYFDAQGVFSENMIRFRIRHRPGIDNTMRISHDGRLYNIKSIVDAADRHVHMELLCSEGVADGG